MYEWTLKFFNYPLRQYGKLTAQEKERMTKDALRQYGKLTVQGKERMTKV